MDGGTKPGDLPVHLPTKFKFIINRKTATALGIEVPLGLLLAGNAVIERKGENSSRSSAARRVGHLPNAHGGTPQKCGGS